MSLDGIQHNAKTIIDLYKAYLDLTKQNNPELNEKILQTKKYILKLSENIQKYIEEERQNVS